MFVKSHGEREWNLDVNFAEQRLFDRVDVRFSARLNKKDASEGRDVIIKDFSPIGIKVLSNQRISLFDRLSISFAPSVNSSIAMQGHVVWIRKSDGETCHAGIKFDEVDLIKASEIMAFCR
jgi:hypothetical protein